MVSRSTVVEITKGWLGTPYRHQASVKGVGSDCLGLLRGVWRELYENEPEAPPPYRPDWYDADANDLLLRKANEYLNKTDIIQRGDVVVFRMKPRIAAKHCAIYIGSGRMIHAVSGRSVCETQMTDWYERRIAGAFTFPGVGG